jgi:nitrogen regulatory protein P-II 1
MKLVMARVQPHRLDPVHEALVDIGVTNLTAIEVKGFGEAVGHAEIHRGAEYRIAFMPMVKIEAIVEDGLVEQVVSAIREASASSPAQRSKVSVFEVMAEVSGVDEPQ